MGDKGRHTDKTSQTLAEGPRVTARRPEKLPSFGRGLVWDTSLTIPPPQPLIRMPAADWHTGDTPHNGSATFRTAIM